MDEQECVNPTTRTSNLKPLRGVPSESGFYGYAGKPLSNADVQALKDKGVIFAVHPHGDIMPDGVRLKYPKYRSDFRNRALKMKKLSAEPRLDALTEFDKTFEEWKKEYDKDRTEGKADFEKWLLDKRGYLLVKKQWRNALLSTNPSDSTKAILGIMEFNKAKPKQTIGVETETKDVSIDPKELLEFALRENGIGLTADQFKELAEQRKA